MECLDQLQQTADKHTASINGKREQVNHLKVMWSTVDNYFISVWWVVKVFCVLQRFTDGSLAISTTLSEVVTGSSGRCEMGSALSSHTLQI